MQQRPTKRAVSVFATRLPVHGGSQGTNPLGVPPVRLDWLSSPRSVLGTRDPGDKPAKRRPDNCDPRLRLGVPAPARAPRAAFAGYTTARPGTHGVRCGN